MVVFFTKTLGSLNIIHYLCTRFRKPNNSAKATIKIIGRLAQLV